LTDTRVADGARAAGLARIAGREIWLNASLVTVVMSVALFALSRTVADPDLWGHVKFGGDIWREGRIILPDPYSYVTGDQLWFNHEWLAEVIFYVAFALGQAPGLIAFKTAVSLVIVGAVYRHLCARGLDAGRAGGIVLLMTPMLVQSLGSVRPQLFTLLLFTALLLVLRAVEGGRARWLWAVPAIFAAWVNLHGGFLLGMAVLLLWSAVHVGTLAWERGLGAALRSAPARAVAATAVLSALAALVNPYGWRLLAFLARPETFVRPEITEWQPLPIMGLYGGMYLALVLLTAVGLTWTRRPRHAALIVVSVCMALLPLTAARHGALTALALTILAGEHIGDAWRRLRGASAPRSDRGRWRRRLWGAGIAVLLATVLVREATGHFRCVVVDPGVIGFPVRAVALLKDSGVEGNLAIFFDWGEYAIWHLSPRIKVSVDGRRETVYSPSVYGRSTNFWLGLHDWSALLGTANTELALVSKQFPSFNLMKLVPGWASVHEDSVSGIFARIDSPAAERIRRHQPRPLPPDGRDTCFP